MFKKMLNVALSFSILFLLSGCGEEARMVKEHTANAGANLNLIDKRFNDLHSYVSNSNQKGIYEQTLVIALDKVSRSNPNNDAVKDMVSRFTLDTTVDGSIYQKYKTEIEELKANPLYNAVKSGQEINTDQLGVLANFKIETDRLRETLTKKNYDENFIDYINILATISTEISPVVIDKSDLSTESGVGSQFVGNPQYGAWKKNQNGDLFWEFFQTYMFLSFIDDMRYNSYSGGYYNYRNNYGYNKYSNRYRYDNWNNKRGWSYYNDKYVKDYAKSSEKQKYTQSYKKAQTKYTSNFKTTNTKVSKATNKISKNPKFKSNFANKNKSASTKYGSKFKSSKSGTPSIKNVGGSRSVKKGK